jgi:Icc-related predicted phosphoesterase
MKITLASDLHLEFSDCYDLKNENNANVLILGGDIMIAEDLHDHPYVPSIYEYGSFAELGRKQKRVQTFRDFLKRMSNLFPHVIYVAGNHEFYHGKWVKGIQYLRDECSQFPNVHFLERDSIKIDDVIFVGGTLWTDMNKGDPLTLHAVRDMMNDFRIIKNDEKGYTNLKPADTVIRHRETLAYIKTVIAEKPDEKFVVVGHHSPSHQSIHEGYRHETLMNGAYHSDLSEFILDHPQIKLWTHGHTHHCFDYVIGETRVVCNPRGYQSDGYSENTGWNPNIILEV